MDLDNMRAPTSARHEIVAASPDRLISASAFTAPAALAAIGIASSWLYYWGGDLHRFTQWVAAYIGLFIANFALYLAACYVVLRSDALPRKASMATLIVVLIFAASFRLQLVDERPYLSSDVYRYIWDGHVQSAGINPYRYVPSAPELEHLRDQEIYTKINRGDYAPTPYPPVAQAIYLAVYLARPLNVTAFKIAMSLFDIITLLALVLVLARERLSPARAIIFAWHPLIIWEAAHSGHIESAALAFLALALLARSHHKPALSGISLALATLTKFYPALLLPAFLFHSNRPRSTASWSKALIYALFNRESLKLMAAFFATMVIAYLPYLSVGSGVLGYLPRELQEEGYVAEGSRYFFLFLVDHIISVPAIIFTALAALALISLGVWVAITPRPNATDIARGAIALAGLFLMLATPRYPWYYALLIPYLCFVPSVGWMYLTGATVLLYCTWYTPNVYPNLPLWIGLAVYLPALALLVWERKARR
jgi:hypothetical protein